MADNNSTDIKRTDDLPTQPIRVSDPAGVTRPIKVAPSKPTAEQANSQPWLLGGLILGTSVLIALVGLAWVLYNFGGFSTPAVSRQPPPVVVVSTPVNGSKLQQPAAVNPVPTRVDATATHPAPAANPIIPVTGLSFDQTRLESFPIQLADLVVLRPDITWGQVSAYHNLADWASAATAQALSADGEQHMSGTGFRSQNTSKGMAVVTSTVHAFSTGDGAQKGVGIMAADVKTTLTNMQVIQTTLTLPNGAKAPATLVTGSLRTGPYVSFIASYANLVVNVSLGGFDSSSTGLDALVKDGKTLGQQMLDRVVGAAPVQ